MKRQQVYQQTSANQIDHFEFLGEKVQANIKSKIELGISTNIS